MVQQMIEKVDVSPESEAIVKQIIPDPVIEPRVLPSFADSRGERWTVDVNVAAIKQAKKALEFDLLDAIGKPEQFQRLYTDPLLLCDLLYCLCQEQAQERGISDEQFGARLAGESIERATDALVAGIADFFPNGRQRQLLKREAARLRMLEEKALELIDRQLQAKGRDLEAQIEQRATDFGKPSTSSPESSAAIPVPTASAN
jgi:hypothetical protein